MLNHVLKFIFTTAATCIMGLSVMASAEEWPDLPVGIKNGVSAQDGSRVFVGLGSANSALYSMDLAASPKVWKALAPFPGPPTNGAASALAGGKLFVFSGSGKPNPDAVSPIIFTDVYAYDIAENRWSRIATKTPVGLLGASAYALDDDRIVIFGGYNKALFDKYLHDVLTTDKEKQSDKWNKIVNTYMGMAPADYRWNDSVLLYTVSTNSWSSLGKNPYLPNTGAALVENANGILLINGEIKPGLRTPQIKEVSFENDRITWKQLAPLPVRAGDALQEGLAGAYAGYSNGALIVAGGANFHGARARSFAAQWFTHEGLPKAWNADIYVQTDGAWKQVNSLPYGLAYGASFTTDDGVLAVGGEDAERVARPDVFLMTWDNARVNIAH